MFESRRVQVELGQIVGTSSALKTLDPESIRVALGRHVRGDWGDLDAHDRAANEAALRNGDRLLSVYSDSKGTRFYVITEWDRSVTTVLLPEDY